ncbi:hypothetical protein SAMN02910353_02452 [Ruminococcus sp. YRD2003]|uniref:hypothetical protein n=1 Tax=Ruminococcus sp. YRD2003 TaxID=1452313 RepID=UPI0008C62CD2|nr:hypothetical protein SAMN02910353_02452 [Ruminococcus flavefaciens]
MSKEYSPLKLIRNKVFPIYQLNAVIEEKKITKEEAFKICILETMVWIRQKFENLDIPDELNTVSPAMYKELDLKSLGSFRIERGYIVEVVYIDDEKSWSFQLVEPDLASVSSSPIPGRVFTTDIAFKITDNVIYGGFRTLVSEPENCNEEVLSLRTGVIKRIVRNPLLKLSHISIPLDEKTMLLNSGERLNFFSQNEENSDRYLLMLVFAEYKNDKKEVKSNVKEIPELNGTVLDKTLDIKSFSMNFGVTQKYTDVNVKIGDSADNSRNTLKKESKPDKMSRETLLKRNTDTDNKPYYIYDIDDIAKELMGYAIVYSLPYNKIREFEKSMNMTISPGDAVIFEPKMFGDSVRYNCVENKDETLNELISFIRTYQVKKTTEFDSIYFVHDARIAEQKKMLYRSNDIEVLASVRSELTKELDTMKSANKELNKYKDRALMLEDKLANADKTIEKLKANMVKKEQEILKIIDGFESKNRILQLQVDYFHSLSSRPQKPDEIAAWIKNNFSDSMILHKKAVDMLNKLPPQSVNMKKLCDSLEYLAVEYYMFFYSKELSEEEALQYAGLKYAQKFNVTPCGDGSIKALPADYKIKFDKNDGNGMKEYPLDLHLKSGVDPSHLIRIYFHYDEINKKIVVGSLPKHLPTISQKT